MSVNTIIEIGSKLKDSKNGIRHHQYVRPCPIDDKYSNVMRLNVPVKIIDENIVFDFDSEKFGLIQQENLIGNEVVASKLMYLRYKTADKANSITIYFFGDIFHSAGDKNYKLEQNTKHGKPIIEKIKKIDNSENSLLIKFFNSFEETKTIFDNIIKYNEGITKFLESKEEREGLTLAKLVKDSAVIQKYTAKRIFFRLKNSSANFKKIYKGENPEWSDIENDEEKQNNLIKEGSSRSIFIHFDFDGKSWYEMEKDMKLIFESLNHDFLDNPTATHNLTFKKILFRGLCSGDEQNDKQFPGFSLSNKNRSRGFSKNEIDSLFYGVGLLDKGISLNKGSDLRMIVLPCGENLKAEDYEVFFEKTANKQEDVSNENKVEEAEKILNRKNRDSSDSWFKHFLEQPDELDKKIIRYDVLLSVKGSQTTNDVVEIQGIQKSFLREVYSRLRTKKDDVYEKISLTREKMTYGVAIYKSLERLLGKVKFADSNEGEVGKVKIPKYEKSSILNTHLLRVLPKIFTGTYFNDDRILPLTIDRIELLVRQGMLSSKQNWHVEMLLYDLEFLLLIQNTSIENQNFLNIMVSKSYELGKNLGRFALFFKRRESDYTPINSFDQEYVGNLRRQIGQLSELKKFADMLFEKYYLHKNRKKYPKYWEIQNGEAAENITRLGAELDEASYDKNECAFGFFESYFERFKEKSLPEKLQTLLEKHESDENYTALIQSVHQALKEFNQK